MPRIFISYRRESAWALAGHVYEKLAHRFGRDNVFIDIDDVEPGVDFVDVLDRTLSVMNAMIVIIAFMTFREGPFLDRFSFCQY